MVSQRLRKFLFVRRHGAVCGGMWRRGNMGTGVPLSGGNGRVARLLVVGLAIAVILPYGATGVAQTKSNTTPTEPLHEALARQAYALAEQWVVRGLVTQETPSIIADNVVAISATIRLEGTTLGYATESIEDPRDVMAATPAGPRNIAPLLQRSMAYAQASAFHNWLTVKERLARRFGDKAPRNFTDTTSRQLLELQFAINLEPIHLDRLDQLAEKIILGKHGLALYDTQAVKPVPVRPTKPPEHGADQADPSKLPPVELKTPEKNKWAWVFPSVALTAGTSLSDHVHQLMQQLEIPLGQFPHIGKNPRYRLYRFEVVHLVRPDAELPVTLLQRGQRVLPAGPLNTTSIQTLTKGLADYLVKRQRNKDGWFTGAYLPAADVYKPQDATRYEMALACYALGRYAQTPELDVLEARHASVTARIGLESLLKDMKPGKPALTPTGEPKAWTADELAMALLAVLQTPGAADMKEQRAELTARLVRLIRADGYLFESVEETSSPKIQPIRVPNDPKPVNPPEEKKPKLASAADHARAAAALVQLWARTRDPATLNHAKRLLHVTWQQVHGKQVIAVMPWIAFAELDLASLNQPTPGLLRLREGADEIWKSQVKAPTAGSSGAPSPDKIGGFDLSGSVHPEPTIHSAAPLAAMARALTVSSFVPNERRIDWLLDTSLGARFVAQLAVDPYSAYYARNPMEAMGGVRYAVWDNRQTLVGNAMALLAATEIRHALAAMQPQANKSP